MSTMKRKSSQTFPNDDRLDTTQPSQERPLTAGMICSTGSFTFANLTKV